MSIFSFPVDVPASNNNVRGEEVESEEAQEFRRQHFDRSSVLRHSKKRKKSSASNPGSVNGTPVKPAVITTETLRDTKATNTNSSLAPTPAKINREETPQKLQAGQNEMTSEITDVDDEVVNVDDYEEEDDDQLATKLEDVVIENIQKCEKPESPSKSDEPMTASARVAAMLAGPAEPAKPAVDPNYQRAVSPLPPPPPSPLAVPFQLSFTDPELFPNADRSPMLEEIPDDAFITDISPLPTPPPTPPPSEIPSVIQDPVTPPPSKPSMTNGNGVKKNIVVTSTPLAKQMLMMTQQKAIKPSAIPTPTRPANSAAFPTASAATTVTPSRIPKLASGSSLPAAHPKVLKTPSGGKMNGKTPIPSSAGKGNAGTRSTPMTNGSSGNGRLVLRTRRQVAQELEDQQRNEFDKSSNEENEDCGRLI
jgi:hypothetical protein